MLQINQSIKSWAEDDRPREKLLSKGVQSLSDAELIAILLGSGSKNESAVSLAQRVLRSVENNLNELGKSTLAELQQFKGIGQAKAITIVAAMEIGRRRQLTDIRIRPQVTNSQDAYNAVAPLLADLSVEEFWIILLNQNNRIIGREQVSSGGVASTLVDAKVLFRKAIDYKATMVILCHNHPSGNAKPSEKDFSLTQKLVNAGCVLDVKVVDHLIVAGKTYFSFLDNDKMPVPQKQLIE